MSVAMISNQIISVELRELFKASKHVDASDMICNQSSCHGSYGYCKQWQMKCEQPEVPPSGSLALEALKVAIAKMNEMKTSNR